MYIKLGYKKMTALQVFLKPFKDKGLQMIIMSLVWSDFLPILIQIYGFFVKIFKYRKKEKRFRIYHIMLPITTIN